MSRIGKKPVPVATAKVNIAGQLVKVEGPKGKLELNVHPAITVKMDDAKKELLGVRKDDERQSRAVHGLTRALLANMVEGVTTGFKKALEVHGVGYRVGRQGNKLMMQLGYSHPIEILPPPGIEIASLETFTPTTANEWLSAKLAIGGIDKEAVGQLAAKIRALRAVEPYKGKGIKYQGERVRRKAGKAGKAGKGRK
jgi:large subunit ribosomal protein L6